MSQNLQRLASGLSKIKKTLNKKSIYTGKSWVLIDDNQRGIFEIEFFKDGRMLYIMGGHATWGTWDIVPSSGRLILDYGKSTSLYDVRFADDSIMTVQNPQHHEVEIFVNKKKIPNLIADFYMTTLWKKHKIENKERSKPRASRTSKAFDHLSGYRTSSQNEEPKKDYSSAKTAKKKSSEIMVFFEPLFSFYRDFFLILSKGESASSKAKDKDNQKDTLLLGFVSLIILALIIWSFFW
ncbi:hypothetical protein [uncultured Algoriphagus sp.]|uniref:hypothetical protein n=1 Tax=uncultured Algoriphagus sp. TaxID=417365 RepID=UPI002588F893|nr:hypothetical protein [uncultured Algoriphagus sp.]